MIIYHCSSYRHHTCCASAIRRPAYLPDGRFSIKICSKLYHQHRRIMDTHGTSDATVGFSKINSKNPTITIPAGSRPGLRASRSAILYRYSICTPRTWRSLCRLQISKAVSFSMPCRALPCLSRSAPRYLRDC